MRDVDYLGRVAKEAVEMRSEKEVAVAAVALPQAQKGDPGVPIDMDAEQAADPVCLFVKLKKLAKASKQQLDELLAAMPDRVRSRLLTVLNSDPKLKNYATDGQRVYYIKQGRKVIEFPLALRTRLLTVFHDSIVGAHRGREVTLKHIKKRFHWIGMSQDVKEYIKACKTCATTKTPLPHYQGLRPIVKQRVFGRIQMDFMQPTTPSLRGHKYILSVVCTDSGKTRLFKMRNRSGVEVARKLIKMYNTSVMPDVLHSDNAPEFIDGVVAIVNKMLGVRGVSGSPYKPSVQGAVENRNKTIAMLLSWMCNNNMDDWDRQLHWVEGAFYRSVFSATGVTPMFYETGFDPVIPFDQSPEEREKGNKTIQEWAMHLDAARSFARSNIELSAQEMKQRFDKGKKQHQIEASKEVYAFWPKKGKLEKRWHGPFVVDTVNDRSAVIHRPGQREFQVPDSRGSFDPKHALPEKWAPSKEEWITWLKTADTHNIAEKEFHSPEDAADDGRDLENMEEERYEIERIVGHKDVEIKKKGKKQGYTERHYDVIWKGYPAGTDRWLHEDAVLDGASKLLAEYLESIGEVSG